MSGVGRWQIRFDMRYKGDTTSEYKNEIISTTKNIDAPPAKSTGICQLFKISYKKKCCDEFQFIHLKS